MGEPQRGEIGRHVGNGMDRRLALAPNGQFGGVEHGAARIGDRPGTIDRIAQQRRTQPGERMDADDATVSNNAISVTFQTPPDAGEIIKVTVIG